MTGKHNSDAQPSVDSEQAHKLVKILKELQLNTMAVSIGKQDYTSEVEYLTAKLHWAEVQINILIAKAVKEAERAYGACHKCYGKGYATVADGIIGYDDFGGEGFKTPITTKIKCCSCDRGKQLATLTKTEKEV